MGLHIMNIGGSLKKFNLNKNGKVVGEYIEEPSTDVSSDFDNNNDSFQPDYNHVKDQINNSEGCKVQGTITVNKVILTYIGSW
jgi:hypothetical protein